MIAFKFNSSFKAKPLQDATIKAANRAMNTLGKFVYRSIRSSIRNKGVAPPGKPYGRGTGFMRDSLIVETDYSQGTVAIGYYRGHKVGDTLEFGGKHRGRTYPERPVYAPALEKAIADFEKKYPGDFQKYFQM